MPYDLPQLPYGYDALSPTIDELTMRLHHQRHHAGYVVKLNAALEGTGWNDRTAEELLTRLELLPEENRAAVRWSAGGHANHSLYWESMHPSGGRPSEALADAIELRFGSLSRFKRQLTAMAVSRSGSGWAWLVHDGEGLGLLSTANEDSPLMFGQMPLLGIDLWEHAYYLRYQGRRSDYVEAWWNLVNWDAVARRYRAASQLRRQLHDGRPVLAPPTSSD
jgi:superoxide dismutase, Fe-Mn family